MQTVEQRRRSQARLLENQIYRLRQKWLSTSSLEEKKKIEDNILVRLAKLKGEEREYAIEMIERLS